MLKFKFSLHVPVQLPGTRTICWSLISRKSSNACGPTRFVLFPHRFLLVVARVVQLFHVRHADAFLVQVRGGVQKRQRMNVQIEQRVKKQKLKHRVHLQAVREPKGQPRQPNHDGPTVQHKDPRFSPSGGFFASTAIATLPALRNVKQRSERFVFFMGVKHQQKDIKQFRRGSKT